jgi:exodeoxyribonuclease VII large subunit
MGEADTETDAKAALSDYAVLDGETAITVDALNAEISEVLDATEDLYFDYVVGDVSDCREANGNVHFDLNHEDNSIHCVLLGYRRSRVDAELEDDLRVAVSGDLTYYKARGSCSVMADDVVELGDGNYQEIYEENRELLAKDGLFEAAHKQSLPAHPETIGLVTSMDSDAREDAVTSIHSRYPDVDIIVQHATVQGDRAMMELMEAISELDRDPEVDVLVLTRGGGADTTLRVFNETPLCRVIFNTETPIVVGIGHERDRTLAEEVADQRVMTPTHAGDVVPEKQAFVEELDEAAMELEETFARHAERELVETMETLEGAFATHARDVVGTASTGLDSALETHASRDLTELRNRLDHAYASLEQAKQLEAEKEAAVEEAVETTHAQATVDLKMEYERKLRWQRAAIAILILLLMGLLAYILI